MPLAALGVPAKALFSWRMTTRVAKTKFTSTTIRSKTTLSNPVQPGPMWTTEGASLVLVRKSTAALRNLGLHGNVRVGRTRFDRCMTKHQMQQHRQTHHGRAGRGQHRSGNRENQSPYAWLETLGVGLSTLAFVPSIDVAELEDVSRESRRIRARPSNGSESAALVGETVTLEELNSRYQLQAVSAKSDAKGIAQAEFTAKGLIPTRFVLGSGAYGQVARAKDVVGRDVAVKVVNRQAMDIEGLQNEVEALTLARRHPNVTELIEVLFCPETDKYYIITEFCGGGELFDRLIDKGPYKEAEAARLIERIASALNYLHSCGFAHMDIKPENLMFSGESNQRDGDIRLIDFGMCKNLNEYKESGITKMTSNVGTTPYLPSEILKHIPADYLIPIHESSRSDAATGGETAAPKIKRKVDIELTSDPRACDMWALGLIIYILLLGCHPFDRTGDATDATIATRALQGSDTSKDDPNESPARFTFNVHKRLQLSEEAKDLITRLLDPNPETRLKSHEVIKHPWLQQARRRALAQHRSVMSKWSPPDSSEENMQSDEEPEDTQDALEHETVAHRAISSAMLIASLAARETRDKMPKDSTPEEYFLKQAYSVLKAARWTEMVEDVEVSKLSFPDFAKLVEQSHSFKYAKGSTIFSEGDDAEGVFILLSGNVQVEYSTGSPDLPHLGYGHAVAKLQPGDVFGEAAVLDGRDFRNATTRCLTPVRVLFWSRDDFVRVICGTNALCMGLEEHLRSRQNLRARRLLEQLEDGAFVMRTFEPGEKLYNQGDTPDMLYVIQEGVVVTSFDPQEAEASANLHPAEKVRNTVKNFISQVKGKLSNRDGGFFTADAGKVPPEAGPMSLRQYQPGSLIGTEAISGSHRIASAVCTTKVTVAGVDRSRLLGLAAQESSLYNTILRLFRRDNEEKLARLRAASAGVYRDQEASSSQTSDLNDLVKAAEQQLLRRQSMHVLPRTPSSPRS